MIIHIDGSRKREKEYIGLEETIQDLGDSLHCLDSTWIVTTTFNARPIRDRLKYYLSPGVVF